MFVHRATTLGAGAERLAAGEIDQLTGLFVFLVVAEVEFEFPVLLFFVELDDDLGHEGPARLGAEAFQRADLLGRQQLFGLFRLKGAAGWRLAEREAAALAVAVGASAAVAAVVFLHHAAAVGAGRLQGGVVAGDGVAVVFLGLLDHALGHGGDLAHEGGAAELAVLHLRQLVFPLAGELGLGEFFHAQAAQQCHELEGLGRGDDLAAFAEHVLLGQQAFDDGRARGRRAQAFFLHRFAQLVVIHQLAGAFHGAQQGGFRIACGWLGLQAFGFHRFGAHGLAFAHRHQVLTLVALFGIHHVFGGFLAIDRHPARLDQHLAFGLEVVIDHTRDAGRDHEFSRREEHRQEAANHQVVQLLLGFAQPVRRLQRGDDGEVVRHLAVVKDALARADVAAVERGARVRRQVLHAAAASISKVCFTVGK
ncbi:hypothetical protein Y695_02928 [Hydrogenophaga sp. T4]|nr:hypothetical protein Y695_02928 [Hydrogenophaga sp. T4]